MSVTIKGRPGQRLEVSGDLSMSLAVPFHETEERFYVGASDGTLIEGVLIAEDDHYDFRVVVAGSGAAVIGTGEMRLEARIEWLTLSKYRKVSLHESEES